MTWILLLSFGCFVSVNSCLAGLFFGPRKGRWKYHESEVVDELEDSSAWTKVSVGRSIFRRVMVVKFDGL